MILFVADHEKRSDDDCKYKSARDKQFVFSCFYFDS